MFENFGKVAYRSLEYRKAMPKDLDDATRLHVASIVRGWIEGGKTKAEVARALGVTKPTVAAILERDEAGLKVARAVAKELGVTLDDLERVALVEAATRAPAETQVAPPPSGLLRHRDYPPIRERLRKVFADEVVEMTDRADFGQMPEFLTWEFVRAIAEAAQKYLIEKEERDAKKSPSAQPLEKKR